MRRDWKGVDSPPCRERWDMIEAYKIISGKVDADAAIWFNPLTTREGASSTRSTTGQLMLARKNAKTEARLNQFSVRIVECTS